MTTAALRPANLFTLIREAALAFSEDKAPRLAAAIAYYAMFSLAPLLLFAVAIAGRFLTDQTVLDQLFGPTGLIAQNLGQDAATYLKGIVPAGEALNKGTVWASVFGFITLFMGATGLFVQLQDALNSMWGADPGPPQGLAAVARTRLIAFVMILGIGLLLLAFLGLNTYLSAIAQHLGDRFGVGAVAVRILTTLLSILFLTPVFATIYKLLPAVKLQWREVWVGGAVTATLFTLGQMAIGIYFGRAAPGSAFGAAGTLVVLLLWIYYSAMIFFFGAEVTWVYSQKHGSHAGGAANTAKKAALAGKGADIDPRQSAQEASAAAHAQRPARDARGRILGFPAPELPRLLPEVPTHAEGRMLPSVRSTIWNAITALFAVPAVIVLRTIGLVGHHKQEAKPSQNPKT